MNRMLLPCGVLFAVLLICGCSQKPANTNAPAAAAPAAQKPAGNVYKLEGAGIQFEIPEGWNRKDLENGVVLSPPEGELSIAFSVIPQPDIKFETITEGVINRVKEGDGEIKPEGQPEEDTHNGLPHTSQSFSGQIRGNPAQWSVDLLKADKPVFVFTTIGAPKAAEARAEEYSKLIKSIKKVQ